MPGCCEGKGELKTLTLIVKGMSCGHCKMAVEKAVRGVNGVKDVEVDLEKGLLKVTYDPERASLTDIQNAVVDAGYEVRKSGENPTA